MAENQGPNQTPPFNHASPLQFGQFTDGNLNNNNTAAASGFGTTTAAGAAPDPNLGNPFYINPNENLAQSVIPIVLDGPNYQMWSKAGRIVLKTKHKLDFIDGSIPVPPQGDPLFHVWDACNTIVLCWITHLLQKDIARSALSHDNAQVLWTELKSRYGQACALKLANLEDDTVKQGTRTITQYYREMKGFLEEYSQFNPIVPCGCAPGNPMPCATVEAFRKKQNTDYLIWFLAGLNPEYDQIKTQLLLMKPLPTVVMAFDDLLQHEHKLKAEGSHKKKTGQSVALAVGGGNSISTSRRANKDNPPAKGDREELFCNYCKKTNHVIKDCWRLKKRRQDREAAENAGRFAGSVGQNIGSEEGSQSEGLHIEVGNRFTSPVGGFTAEEMSRLRGILQMSNSTSPTSP
ncbi:unnamed protein product [Linum trigynum]|uniref:Retrotransposon Copia-like N-terminal domain-containing protein n=1 Tax=Linum trigynum TaxID=586398 RepID=A0AAV2G9N8_9ROSI